MITDDTYKSLGFKSPDFIENQYGIKIYLGTKDKEDWCIEIPKEIARRKSHSYALKCNVVFYLISEAEVIRLAKEYTELAEWWEDK